MSTEGQTVAWAFSLATALWFGWAGWRASRNWFAYGFAGWLVGLVATTLIIGLAEAAYIPISPNAYLGFQLKSALAAVVVIAAVGVIFTRSAKRQSPEPAAEAK
jgi:hypothetical protein